MERHEPNLCIQVVRLGGLDEVVAKGDARRKLAGAVLGEPDVARLVGQGALVLGLGLEVAVALVLAVLHVFGAGSVVFSVCEREGEGGLTTTLYSLLLKFP